jgi:hypothetical protein
MLDEVQDSYGAFDNPDSRDFRSVHIFGEPQVVLPAQVILNCVPSHDQKSTMHCTAYGLTHCVEIINTIEHSMQVNADPEEQWANQKLDNPQPEQMEQKGDSLQNALRSLLKHGLNNKVVDVKIDKFLIEGYARIPNDIESCKKWLYSGMPIYTGSGNHCYCLVGYDDAEQAFIAKNSYGPNWGKKGDGTFLIKYEEFSKLFSKYIIYDKKDLVMIFKDVSVKSPHAEEIKFCLEHGFMRGYGDEEKPQDRLFGPERPVTRAELAIVVTRLYQSLFNQ